MKKEVMGQTRTGKSIFYLLEQTLKVFVPRHYKSVL